MRDAFLAHPPLQPKREICDYLASEGIRVPARIANLQDAIRDGYKFIIRGEHPQDYDGASDLLESMVADPKKDFAPATEPRSEQEIVDAVLDRKSIHTYFNLLRHLPMLEQRTAEKLLAGLRSLPTRRYCELLGLDEEVHRAAISFSYWQYIDGWNHAIVADSAIASRYHVFSHLYSANREVASYVVSDQGRLEERAHRSATIPVIAARLPRLVALYERVRKLPKFDPRHCPILEVQTTDDEVDYCLQVHRTRDFEPAAVDIGPLKKEESYFCRGASQAKDGSVYEVSICSSDGTMTLPAQQPTAAVYHFNSDVALTELMLKRTGMCLMHARVKDDHFAAQKFAIKHCRRSQLFKPPIFVQVPVTDVFSEAEISTMQDDQGVSFPVHVVSDGRRAMVKRA
ncbi:MAG: Uncharacterized protein G01um101425_1031 [Candidatus Peregrinibacteria bacterium Gr01-1014_25]|nr:MAG: Uncharacterized protein G01um101425_1031 [Candidatus Peregrinibacteria bacterium Gr01-1014_25]